MDQETNEAANIIIAELKAQAETLHATLRTHESHFKKVTEDFEREKIQHSYLQVMYNELLEKVIK